VLEDELTAAGYLFLKEQDYVYGDNRVQVPVDMHAAGKGYYAPRLGKHSEPQNETARMKHNEIKPKSSETKTQQKQTLGCGGALIAAGYLGPDWMREMILPLNHHFFNECAFLLPPPAHITNHNVPTSSFTCSYFGLHN
jgi:hypothetical protein